MKYSPLYKINQIFQKSGELWPREDLKFANGLMGRELVLIWSYLSQFVIPLTDFADLGVFHDAKIPKIEFCDVII